MTGAAERSACRALLRLCKRVDQQPASLVPLLGQPPSRFDVRHGRTLRMQRQNEALPFIDDAIWEACGCATEYAHHEEGAARRAVSRHFRRCRDLGFMARYVGEANELERRIQRARAVAISVGAIHDGADAIESCGDSRGSGPLRDIDASTLLLNRFAPNGRERTIAGDFLVTHPMSCLFETVFDQAVLLLEGPSSGVVLNKPTGVTLAQMLERWRNVEDRATVSSLRLGPLLDSRLFRGGPVISANSLQDSLRWLHPHGERVDGARKVAPSMWLGGNLGEVALCAKDKPDSVRFFLGYSAWAPAQLQAELASGVWFHARADGSKPETTTLVHELCLGLTERAQAWQAAMRGLGAPHIADFPRGASADRKLRRHIEACHRSPTAGQDSDPSEKPSATETKLGSSKQDFLEEREKIEVTRGRRSTMRRRQ